MKRLVFIFFLISCYSQIMHGQIYGFSTVDIVKAADMVLDINSFGPAHTVLAMHGLPVNDQATDEFAKQSSKNWYEYRDYIATNAYIYWPEYQTNASDLLMGRLSAYNPNESDIKELYFVLGETYHDKFLNDLPLNGYSEIASETKKDNDFNVSYLETIFQKENHLCITSKSSSSSTMNVSFTRIERIGSAEDKMISEQCERFVWLHSINGARSYSLTDMNVPYEIPAIVDIQFPPENTVVSIPIDVLSKNMEPIDKRLVVNVSSYGNLSIESYNDKEKAFFDWIKQYINVKSTAKVNFPRYGKGFVIGDSFYLTIHETDDIDSCTVSFKVKYKDTDDFVLKNKKHVEANLISIYGNADMLTSIWSSFPREEMSRAMYFIGYTYEIKVHIYRRKVTYTFNNQSVTYSLPFAFSWGKPIKQPSLL